jgi:predicted TIM-barrel fold metal-dependent hydrolase
MKKYRNVYTDISFTLYKKPLHPAILSLINDTELNGKILFGTDYYMATRFITESKMYNDFREYLSQSSASEWEDISVVNPRQFLTSSFYTA